MANARLTSCAAVRHDGRAIGRVLLRLLVVAANDVAPAGELHGLGFVIDLLGPFADHERDEWRRIVEHPLAYDFVGALANTVGVRAPCFAVRM